MLGPSIIFKFSRATRPSVKPPRPTNGQKIGHLDDVLMTSRTHFPPLALHFPFFFKKKSPAGSKPPMGVHLGTSSHIGRLYLTGPQRCSECAHKKRGGSDDQRMSGYFYIFFFLQCASALTRVRTFFLKKKKKKKVDSGALCGTRNNLLAAPEVGT